MAPRRDIETLVKVARLYYAEGRNQSRIARELDISTSSVSRMLTQARNEGLVTIIINDPNATVERCPELEKDLIDRFALTRAWVAKDSPGVPALDLVGRLAAEVFVDLAPQIRSVGLSWGRTVASFARSVNLPAQIPSLELYPLAGGMPDEDAATSGNAVIGMLAEGCGGRAHRVDAPAIVQAARTGRALRAEPMVARALEAAARSDLAFVGVGSMGVHWSAGIVRTMNLSDEELEELRTSGVAGDLCGRFLNDEGKPIVTVADDHVIGVTLDQLAAIPRRIGVMSGAEKSRGATAALRSGVLTGVVLDEHLAEVILSAS
ncbi:Transcriptional regulator [Acidipropionibacterium acidipropionici ATCC 4875]|uniref:Transcriptional regulator n=1 Tax=Acidipropionibacterium acidipropionici (strain ATCC 4875 / DSM 20272 / JCM 6432 / NBRC 12425 / NCIMB 8070 / 4) TaxID=1171373 RepID=K7RUL6_ACIA4|nr:sugar-binding domain-containing protein [Acidipropionibacterium acidipropionici]AFV88663.1 Transcriptional regulator [Acidipropionibacterium acidipropionici ATCC 4875]